MKRIILSICLYLTAFVATAQLTATGNKLMLTYLTGIDYVIIFDKIDAATELSYNGKSTTINWYKFSDLSTSVSNFSTLYPEDATGYVLDVDGKRTTIWVINYSNYLPVFNSFEPENMPATECNEMNLLLNVTVPELKYQTIEGSSYTLKRVFKLNYQDVEWSGSAWSSPTNVTPLSVTLPTSKITVPAPLCNTEFTITGDQYADSLGIVNSNPPKCSYTAVAVECHPSSTVTTRDEKNEGERPTTASQLSGSSPLDILFQSNANEPTEYYNWNIYKGGQLLVSRKDEEHRYTFEESGTYTVKLTASNAYCSDSDSIIVTVIESKIEVPNVFTPNGDGFNDEFRVAFKSLAEFHCWVYNRWGRLVYRWSDPRKGWNGYINGKKASEGPYFYVIKAIGTDKVNYKLKGDINLIRGKLK